MITKHLQWGGATDFRFLRQCNVWRCATGLSSPSSCWRRLSPRVPLRGNPNWGCTTRSNLKHLSPCTTAMNWTRWKYSYSVLFLLVCHILPTAVFYHTRHNAIFPHFRAILTVLTPFGGRVARLNIFNGSEDVFPLAAFLAPWRDKISMDKNRGKTDNDIFIRWCFIVVWLFCCLVVLLTE